MIALTVSLGNWQTRRAAYKTGLQERFDARQRGAAINLGRRPVDASALEFGPIAARGHWVDGRTVYIDNRVHRGVAGYYVVTPLRIEGGTMHVMVVRGWARAGRTRDELPEVRVQEGVVEVSGQARIPSENVFRLGGGTAEQGRVWQHLSLSRMREWSKLELQPVVLYQTSDAEDGLVRAWERPDLLVDKHRGYALQWYGMAAATAILWLVLSFRKSDA